MRFLHHLARTGGTLISRCLAAMDGTCLLSEINPLGIGQFNPLRQAADWYGLVDQHEVRKLNQGDVDDLRSATLHIESRAAELGMNLIVRDWSHLDFVGFPFNQPTLRSSWEDVLPGVANEAVRCATVRHPVDQFRSSRALPVLRKSWDDAAFWRGLRVFAESVQNMPWFRYEDFLAAPGQTLQEICDALEVAYDPQWQSRWAGYAKITGETVDSTRDTIKPEKRKRIEPAFWSGLRKNEDFFWTLELLGYSVPEPLRRCSVRGFELPRCAVDTKEEIERERPQPGHQRWDDAVAQWRQQAEDDANDWTAALRLAESLLWIGETSQAVEHLLKVAKQVEIPASIEVPVLLLVCEALELFELAIWQAISTRIPSVKSCCRFCNLTIASVSTFACFMEAKSPMR